MGGLCGDGQGSPASAWGPCTGGGTQTQTWPPFPFAQRGHANGGAHTNLEASPPWVARRERHRTGGPHLGRGTPLFAPPLPPLVRVPALTCPPSPGRPLPRFPP